MADPSRRLDGDRLGPHATSRKWSRAIYDAYPRVQGLWYSSAMCANRPSVALYERGSAALSETALRDRPLASHELDALVLAAARSLGYPILPPPG